MRKLIWTARNAQTHLGYRGRFVHRREQHVSRAIVCMEQARENSGKSNISGDDEYG